jgi:signal transduction histidine kinase
VFLITGIAVLLVITFAWGVALKHQWNVKIRPHLVQYIDYVHRDLGSPPDPQRAAALARVVPVNIYIQGPGINYSTTGELLDTSEIEFDEEHHHRDQRWHNERLTTASGLCFSIDDYDDHTLVRTIKDGYSVYYELRHRVQDMRHQAMRRQGRVLLWGTLLVLLGLLAACWWVIHRLLRPVRDIQAGVARMGSGELDPRIALRRRDDLGELSELSELSVSINEMAGDIEQMLLGISHQLRSPITRAKISTELLEPSTTRSRLEDDLLEMETLVTELLESERLNSRHSVLNPQPVDLSALIDSVLAQNFRERVTLRSEAVLPTLVLDETQVRLLLRNLLANAVRYSRDEAPLLHVAATERTLTITVSGTGLGIAPEHLASLTDPFYRVDPSRTRATGGFGLGLYLCRLICEAHGGELSISSTLGVGTTVVATLNAQGVHRGRADGSPDDA